jgi:L-Lysine epsilon oxidase N-terminal/L-lysine epsilon oxidase C-terminal domain
MSSSILRVHPAVGIARVGNSDAFYLGPESIAALPIRGATGPERGGLPIRPGTEATTIRSSELRDAEGRFKRQAARFRIYQYPADQASSWPAQGGSEVTVGSVVDGRVVVDIVWTVHLANKKAAWYVSPDEYGNRAFEEPELLGLTLRNLPEGQNPHNKKRLSRMIIDAGPRAVSSVLPQAAFDANTQATRGVGAEIQPVLDYPVSFPRTNFEADMLNEPQGAIDTLGDMHIDDLGRLVVAGGRGRAVAWSTSSRAPGVVESISITDPVNNDNFFDDTSDGPVTATLVFSDGSTAEVQGAWVVVTDPSYAPQTLNVVSLWDEVFDTFLRQLDLDPRVYRDGAYQRDYRPSFPDHVQPVFLAADAQMWNAYLPPMAIRAHRAVGKIAATDNPDDTILAGLAFIRNPNKPESAIGAPLMPLALGDSGKSFLAPTFTQYFFLEQWASGAFDPDGEDPATGFGEYLDRAVFANCLGGRFSPGIDLTFIVRDPQLYVTNWREAGTGPFRFRAKPLNYGQARSDAPFLGLGWMPATPSATLGLEPGDICKFMALPWHADYNSCAIHPVDPNPLNSQSLYWSWPAQRPVHVYVATDVTNGKLGDARYSIRGTGTMPLRNTPTDAGDLANAGRFWDYGEMLVRWNDIGVIMQATNIDDGREVHYRSDQYLEVQSLLDDGPPELKAPQPWPFLSGDGTALNKK